MKICIKCIELGPNEALDYGNNIIIKIADKACLKPNEKDVIYIKQNLEKIIFDEDFQKLI